jgi:hypothetical protein
MCSVAAAKLKLVGRHHTWHDGVREGQLRGEDGAVRKVLIRPLSDVPAEPQALQATRAEARVLARIQHQNVLRVEHVTALQGKAALVVEAFGGISLARVLPMLEDRHTAIPLRASVEIVTTVASAVDAATAPVPGEDEHCVIHPGPEPGEILVDSLGRIKLAGFRVAFTNQPLPVAPEGYAPPEGIDPLRPSAYGLGALLVELLTGAPPPPPGTDEQSHERTLRRTTTRIAAKVGQAGWEDLVRIVRATLAFEPTARLSPADFARELRAHTLEQRSPRLRTWAPAAIPELCRALKPKPKGQRAVEDPSHVAAPVPSKPATPEDPPTVVAGPDASELAQLTASFGPPRALDDDEPSEDMATEVVSPELLARIRAAPLEPSEPIEKTVAASAVPAQVSVVEDAPAPAPAPPAEPEPAPPAVPGPPPALTPPPALPPLDDAPLRAGKPALGGFPALPPLPEPDDAPTVKWSVGDPPPSAPTADPSTEEVARLATEEAPTAEQPGATPAEPPRLPDPRAIAPEAPDSFGPLDDAPPKRKRRSAMLLLLPLAAALLLGAWTAWYFLPGLLSSLTDPTPAEPNEELLSALLDAEPVEPVAERAATALPEPDEPPEGPAGSELSAAGDQDPTAPLDPALASPPDRTAPLTEADTEGSAPDPGSAREQAIASIRDEQDPPGAPEPEPGPAQIDPEPEQDPPAQPDPPPTAIAEPEPERTAPAEPEHTTPAEPEHTAPAESEHTAPAESEPVADTEPTLDQTDPADATEAGVGLFRVEFRAGHPDVYELEVRCHQGSAKGPPPLILNDAGKGPCRVTAFTSASGRMIAWIGLTGPATLTCFQDGQRACQ